MGMLVITIVAAMLFKAGLIMIGMLREERQATLHEIRELEKELDHPNAVDFYD